MTMGGSRASTVSMATAGLVALLAACSKPRVDTEARAARPDAAPNAVARRADASTPPPPVDVDASSPLRATVDIGPCARGADVIVSRDRADWAPDKSAGAVDLMSIATRDDLAVATWTRRPPEPQYGDALDEYAAAARIELAGSSLTALSRSISSSSSAASTGGSRASAVMTDDASLVAWGVNGNHTYGLLRLTPSSFPADAQRTLFDEQPYAPTKTGFEGLHFHPSGAFVAARPPDARVGVAVLARGARMTTPSWGPCYEMVSEGRSYADCLSGSVLAAFLVDARDAATARRIDVATGDGEPVAIAFGRTRGAYLLRDKKQLLLGWLGADGAPAGSPQRLRDGDLGGASLAFADDTLFVVWSERAPGAKYRLQLARISATARAGDAIPPPVAIASHAPSTSDTSPSMASDGGNIVMAWTAGDAKNGGSVLALSFGAAGPSRLEGAPLNAKDVVARDARVAIHGKTVIAIWAETTKQAPGGEVRVARLACGR